MQINADFTKRASVHGGAKSWVSSPIVGIERQMLDRIGGEVARATSLVRYAPKRRFPAHTHVGGEEYFVLDGVFRDEHGSFPAGCYVRNPPGTSHAPWSDEGCTIFVKLWQFDPQDRSPVVIQTRELTPSRAGPGLAGAYLPLFRDHREEVRLEHWEAGATLPKLVNHAGIELLVLEGSFEESGVTFDKRAWLRLPPGAAFDAQAGSAGVKLWIKYGHLARPPRAPIG
jgi:anti-sigma factor ChrR (cupin superfamily)